MIITETDITQEEAQRRLYEMSLYERCCLFTPNGKVEQFLQNLDRPDWKPGAIYIFILRGPNSGGKTTIAINLAAYLAKAFPNPYFRSINFLRGFKRPNRGRVYTTLNAASTTYPDEAEKWLPAGKYTPKKNGNTYYSLYTFPNRSRFDVFSFDRDVKQGESTTLDWAIVDEPLPEKLWSGLVSRLRWGGPVFFFMTALDDAAWINARLEDAKRLNKDVFVVEMDARDCSVEYGIRGHMPYAYYDSLAKECDEDDLDARMHGKYKTLSGAVYKKFDVSVHVLSDYMEYHKQCINSGHYNIVQIQDPHPRKPFAIGWYYVFPNGDVVTVSEFPDDTWKPFHLLKSCDLLIDDYAELIKETEKAFQDPVMRRLMDPNMGNSPAEPGGRTYKQKFAGHKLYYEDPIDNLTLRHLAVKDMLGNPAKGRRPQFYVMEWCHNHIFGLKNYAWDDHRRKEELSEVPVLKYKDFPDLVGYGAMSGFKYVPPARFRKPQPKVWLPKAYKKK